jgi:hypothetical protein
MEFLRFLGISSVADLPQYDSLRSHENIVRILEMAAQQKEKDKEKAVAAPAAAGETPAETPAE